MSTQIWYTLDMTTSRNKSERTLNPVNILIKKKYARIYRTNKKKKLYFKSQYGRWTFLEFPPNENDKKKKKNLYSTRKRSWFSGIIISGIISYGIRPRICTNFFNLTTILFKVKYRVWRWNNTGTYRNMNVLKSFINISA